MRLLSIVLVSLVCAASPPVEADLLDKLKKQVKDSAKETKEKTKQTVEEEAGVGSAQTADQLRADLTRKWQACYDSMLASDEYRSCASICNAARQSIADFDGAAKANQSTWKRCNDAYNKAKASAPALTQSAKEKQQGLPAGALPTPAATSGGVDMTDADSLRADADRMRSECQARRQEGVKFGYCSTRCSQSSQKISNSSNAAAGNAKAWQFCKSMYDDAMGGSAPATAATTTPASTPSAKPAVAPVPSATASSPSSSKPAVAAQPKSSLTATAADKAAADKYAQGCASNYHLSGTYDCQCMRQAYLDASLLVREDNVKTWVEQYEPYRRANLDRAKQNGKGVEAAQKLYDEGKASAYGTPDPSHVGLRMEGGPSAKCYSRPAIIKTQKTQCMERNGQKTPMGTPIDDKYCGCYAEKYASQLIDKGQTGTQVTTPAQMACDTESPLYKMQNKK